jgi:hypothetical protein
MAEASAASRGYRRTEPVLTAGIAQMATALCQDTRNTILGSALQAGGTAEHLRRSPAHGTYPCASATCAARRRGRNPSQAKGQRTRPGVQKYEIIRAAGTPDKFRLLETQFAGPTDAARDVNLNTDLHRNRWRHLGCCKTSAEYCGHRWLKMAAADLHMPQELEPTAFVKRENSMVAMLSVDQTHVVEVFASQIAAEKRVSSVRSCHEPRYQELRAVLEAVDQWTWRCRTCTGCRTSPGNMPHAGSMRSSCCTRVTEQLARRLTAHRRPSTGCRCHAHRSQTPSQTVHNEGVCGSGIEGPSARPFRLVFTAHRV